jgi:hypothetical protein
VDAPIRYAVDGTEVMFTLPNGLWGFAVATPEGSLVSQLPNCVVECPLPFRATLSVTCRGCHSGGLLGVSDDMLTYALAYPRSYDADTFASIQAEYRPDLHQSLAQDQLRYYAALVSAVGEGTAPDRIGRVYNEFWSRPLDAAGGRRRARHLAASAACGHRARPRPATRARSAAPGWRGLARPLPSAPPRARVQRRWRREPAGELPLTPGGAGAAHPGPSPGHAEHSSSQA